MSTKCRAVHFRESPTIEDLTELESLCAPVIAALVNSDALGEIAQDPALSESGAIVRVELSVTLTSVEELNRVTPGSDDTGANCNAQ